MRSSRFALVALAVVALAVVFVSVGAAGDDGDNVLLGNKRTIVLAERAHGGGHKGVPSEFNCTTPADGAGSTIDCDGPNPNNEPHIAVDPANPGHMIASSNDYDSCCDQYYTTFDGGSTWSTGDMSTEANFPIGSDPVTSFDRRHGLALHASLNYFLSDDGSEACNGDVVVSPSRDGGLTWAPPTVAYHGFGCDLDPTQVFNDKEWIVTDNNPHSRFYGRTYVTWTRFLAHDGETVDAPIWSTWSDDGGRKWARAQEISGSSRRLCGGRCSDDQFSSPVVGPDGTVYVAFENGQNTSLDSAGEEEQGQYLLVSSRDGGDDWSDPQFITAFEDGSRDYPLNADGRQTLSGYQIRLSTPGNLAVSPRDGKLWVTWADNRNGVHDSDHPRTNNDVFVMSSSNGGRSWSDPSLVDNGHGDQWFPWLDVNPVTGKIGIIYNDRGNRNGDTYTVSLVQGLPGAFTKTTLSKAPSDPVHSAFFQAETPGCEMCALFHGDYISLAYGSDGRANGVWTDMSTPTPDGFAQFIGYARR